MRNFFEEYGLTILVTITGILVLMMVMSSVRDGEMLNSIFVLEQGGGNGTALAVQESVNDESLKDKKLKPILETHDIILDYGAIFDIDNYIGDACTNDCFKAYVEDNGKRVDLINFVSMETATGFPVDTTKPGQHDIFLLLRWNNEFVKNKVRVFVLEDPNMPDLGGSEVLNNVVMGILKDKDLKPVIAPLQLRAVTDDGTALIYNAKSSESGSFMFYGVKPNCKYELYVVGQEDTPISTFDYPGGEVNMGLVGIR